MRPCSDPSLKHQSRIKTVSFNVGMVLYPNPCKDFMNLELKTGVISKIEVYSKDGRMIWSQNSTETINEMKIETHQLPQGVYILLLYTPESVISAKFLKE